MVFMLRITVRTAFVFKLKMGVRIAAQAKTSSCGATKSCAFGSQTNAMTGQSGACSTEGGKVVSDN